MQSHRSNEEMKTSKSHLKWPLNLEKLLDKNQLKTFSKLFQNTNDFIFFSIMGDEGLPGSVIEVNDTTCSKLGYTREEFLALPPEKLGSHMDNSSAEKVKNQLLQEEPVFFEMIFFAKSGMPIPVEVNASIFILEGQNLVLSVARDITECKKIEKKLMENNKELTKAMDELKHTQQQLLQQEKLAAIGQLAAGVAHEVNNPLGYIYSNFETSRNYFDSYKKVLDAYRSCISSFHHAPREKLKTEIDQIKNLEEKIDLDFIGRDLEELFEDIEDGLERISEIVMSLKTFSRVDQNTRLEAYSLNEGIKNVLLVARNEIKHHARVVEVLSDIPVIQVLGNQINQVLLNVTLNALYAIKEKKSDALGLITVSSRWSKEYIICQIEDNGIGIEDVYKNRIFDPFFTTKPTGQGTGLGLSIAYDIIVNKNGGEIIVDSTPGVGTKFTIKLPIEPMKRKLVKK
ncbi:PAS domain-containing sensor histidine kinase [Alkaliphilus serpentinus]|uniref:histidine kinase n=1 Tax=Alkaliphilus serpentinus TaxID=1482731 RepID=A0A833HLJ6_9FIRM|nr:ATP-binding protein [Alkaliphilus serpentinus]KAB3525936.1 PAS domain S-box protein [Alkaliphilus serpentinus]